MISIASVVALLAIVGVQGTQTETSFLKNFRDDSGLVVAYRHVETELGGAGVWDIVLPAPDQLNDAYLESVRTLQERLRTIKIGQQRLSKVISMADAERVAAKVQLLSIGPPDVRMTAMRTVLPVFVDALLTPAGETQRRLRIMLRSREQLPTEIKSRLIREVERVVREHTATEDWRALSGGNGKGAASPIVATSPDVTGYYVMLSELVGRLVADQWTCFAVAFGLVLVLLCWMSRSLWCSLLAVVCNALPAIAVLAMIGWTGGKLNLGAAMIAAVSIGLSIDGSVHVLHQFGRLRRKGKSSADAAEVAGAGVGKPMVFSMMALVVGFGVLATSDFVPTATFGILVAATLVIGTIVNLTLLPAVIAGDLRQSRSSG
ncbi:MAG: MMPL family transporter [Planctomycetota bacterium]